MTLIDAGPLIALIDRPMDLADASLVCLAEQRGIQDIFTLDRRDFLTYRFAGRRPFRLWLET